MVVDPPNVQYRYLENSDVQYYHNVVKDGSDGTKDKVLGEVGLGIENPETMSVLDAVDAYS